MINKLRLFFCLLLFITGFLAMDGIPTNAQTRQELVHHMAHSVMPFDVSKTTHIFKMTESGGIQQVVTKDPEDSDQIPLIRQHLQHEAKMFQAGNYSDPAKLHGAHMPGLKELQDGTSRIKVTYAEQPSGAQFFFKQNLFLADSLAQMVWSAIVRTRPRYQRQVSSILIGD